MEASDKKRFATLMATMCAAYGLKVSEERSSVYWEFLKDLPIESVSKGVAETIKHHKFSSFPSIGEIREHTLGEEEDIETNAFLAWERATRLVGMGWKSDDNDLNDAVVTAFGGWSEFGMTDPDNEPADRAHFIRVFKALARKKRIQYLQAEENIKRLKGKTDD